MIFKVGLEKVYWDLSKVSQIKDRKEVLKEFEAYFIEQFLKEALKPQFGGLFGRSFQSKLYRDLFAMELSEHISQGSPLGLEKLMEEALRRYRSVKG